MRMTLEQVKARLGEAGAAPPLRPRPGFVDTLESRLLAQAAGGDEPAALRLPSHPSGLVRRRRALLALAAVGAVLTGLVLTPYGQDAPGRVRTVDVGTASTPGPVSPVPAPAPVAEPVIPPPAPSPAATVVPTAPRPRPPAGSGPKRARVPAPAPTTAVAPPAAAPASPLSDPGPAPERPSTRATSLPPPGPDVLELRCRAGTTAGGPKVSCEWSEPSSAQFAGYRLMRKTASGGTIVKVFATRERAVRSYIDTTVQQSERYGYVVEARDASGRVIARSRVASATCCPA